jgi:endonuclease/exonuclease/phosphatase family metal-dependent hydrolase
VAQLRSEFVVLPGHGDAAHPELEHWHGNIGQQVAVDLGAPLSRAVSSIDVVSWNVAIGLGRVEELVGKLRAESNRPLILLLQEAYRSDSTVPEQLKSAHHGGKHPRQARKDIVEIARALDFSLRYAPSMRNGAHRSDRGNAVLSSTAIVHARAFPLPHVRQRRVAVAVELHGLPWLTLVSAHLDTRGRVRDTRMTGRYASGRAAQATELARRLIDDLGTGQMTLMGADLNTYLGSREPALHALAKAGFVRISHGRSHTFHSPPVRMLLDHILIRGEASVRVTRIDEDHLDRGNRVFGSDHHPLLARIELRRPERRVIRRG